MKRQGASKTAGRTRLLGRVLLAEDEDLQRSTLEQLLRGEGFDVVGVEDGYELNDYLQLTAPGGKLPAPDVIISDVRMPGETGLEVLQQARARGLAAPVLFVTGYPSPEVAAKVEALGKAKMFGKPLDVEAFLGELRAILGGR